MTSLVVAPGATSPFSGAGLLDDGASLAGAFQSGSWLEGGIASFSLVGDLASMITNPLGTLISWGFGWVMDHLNPLKEWLESLTGNAAEVTAIAATWERIGVLVQKTGEDVLNHVVSGTQGQSGETIDAYRALQDDLTAHIANVGGAVGGFGQAMNLAALVVDVVHGAVRDIISDIVGKFLAAAIESAVSVGILLPKAIANVATMVAKWSSWLSTKLKKPLDSFQTLQSLLRRLDAFMHSSGNTLTKLGGRLPKPVQKAVAGVRAAKKAIDSFEKKVDDIVKAAGGRAGRAAGRAAARPWNTVAADVMGYHPKLPTVRQFPSGDEAAKTLFHSDVGHQRLKEMGLGDMSFDEFNKLRQTPAQKLPKTVQNQLTWFNSQPEMQGASGYRMHTYMNGPVDTATLNEAEAGAVHGFNAAAEHVVNHGTKPTELYDNLAGNYYDTDARHLNPRPGADTSYGAVIYRPSQGPGTELGHANGIPLDTVSHQADGAYGSFYNPRELYAAAPSISNPYTGHGATAGPHWITEQTTPDAPRASDGTRLGPYNNIPIAEGEVYRFAPDGSATRTQLWHDGRWYPVNR